MYITLSVSRHTNVFFLRPHRVLVAVISYRIAFLFDPVFHPFFYIYTHTQYVCMYVSMYVWTHRTKYGREGTCTRKNEMVFLILVYAIIFATYDHDYVYKIEKVYLEIYRKGFPDGRYASRVLHQRYSPPRKHRVPARNHLYIPLIYIIKKEKASEHWNDFLVSVSRRNGFPELFIDKYDYTQYTSVQTRRITFSRIKKQYLKAVRATNSEWVINFAFLPFVERAYERTRFTHIQSIPNIPGKDDCLPSYSTWGNSKVKTNTFAATFRAAGSWINKNALSSNTLNPPFVIYCDVCLLVSLQYFSSVAILYTYAL